MNHPERKQAKRFDMPGRCAEFTDLVYSGVHEDPAGLWERVKQTQNKFDPPAPEYNVYFGEMHGHSILSDGISADQDVYYQNIRNLAKLDFAALTDHDHGGVGKPELWVGNPSKWNIIQETAKKYYEPGKFTTLLAYERDSYPYYNNMILYFNNHDADMVRGVRDGEITAQELRALLARDDVVVIPHDTYSLSSGADFEHMDLDLITPLIEMISRADPAEYMGHPAFARDTCCEGGYWLDALKRGAKMGCIAGSDDHDGMNGRVHEKWGYPGKYPGITGVWAKENTVEGIFEAIKSKRTFCFMGGRMTIDFRINGHYMGEEITLGKEEHANIFIDVQADTKIKRIALVKNGRERVCLMGQTHQMVFDYFNEQETDFFYLRVETEDGRYGWCSPIWVARK